MRDYVLHDARSRDSTFAFPKLRRMVRSFIAKRQLRQLAALDDYMLNDIGLNRDDLRYALRLPYDIDPAQELMTIQHERMARGVRHK